MEAAGKVWHSPLSASLHLSNLAKQVGIEAIDTEGQYKRVREARSVMVTTAYMFQRIGVPFYFRLLKDDPPDCELMHTTKEAPQTIQLTRLELSSYQSDRGESFLEQLQRKVPKTHYFDESYILLYNVADHVGIDFEACRDYLNGIGARFPVWVQHVEQFTPDTIASVTVLNPDIGQIKVNAGKAAYDLKQQKVPPIVFTKRTGTIEKVGVRKGEKYLHPPWENLQ